MNIAFTRLIKIRGLLREVNFRRLPLVEGTYHVDVTDERGTRLLFLMKKSEGDSWRLAGPALPAWITEAEGLFGAAIALQEGEVEEGGKRTA